MKNKIYVVGLVSLSLTVLGGIFKIMHWPGAGILLILGYGSLSFIFFPLALRSSFLGDGKKKVGLYLAAFIALFADFLGALFKIMHWPGAGWMLIFGITFPVIVFLPVYIYFHVKEKEKSLVNFMYIMFLLVYLGVMSAFLAVRVQKEVLNDAIRVSYISDIEDYYAMKTKAFDELKSVSEIKSKASELVQFIDEIKIEMVQFPKEGDLAISESGKVNLWMIKGKDDFNIPEAVMIGDSEEQKTGKAFELKTKMEEYKKLLNTYSNGDKVLKKKIDEILEIKEYSLYGEKVPWESYHFKHKTIIHVLNTLEEMQNDVALAETEVLTYLIHKETR